MMKQLIFSAGFVFLASSGFCQTKLIAHKSHSGKPAEFKFESRHNIGEYIPPKPETKKDTSKKGNTTTVKTRKKNAKKTIEKPKAAVRKPSGK